MNRARLTATLAASVALGILAGCASNRDEVPPEYAYVLDSFPPIGEYRSQVWYVYRRTGQLPPTTAERLQAWETEQAEIADRKSKIELAVQTFIDACVKTAADPNAAPEALEAAGMKVRGFRFFSSSAARYASDFGSAVVHRNTESRDLGQCSVQARDAGYDEIAPLVAEMIAYPDTVAETTEDPTVYALAGTDTYVVLDPETGRMVRTQPFPEETGDEAEEDTEAVSEDVEAAGTPDEEMEAAEAPAPETPDDAPASDA